MLHVVCDTNVYISAFNFKGIALEVLLYLIDDGATIYISPPILEEIDRILTVKFKWPPEKVREVIDNISGFTTLVNPRKRLDVITTDPADNRILECAVESGADIILSGDHSLLDLKRYEESKFIHFENFLTSSA